MSPSIQVKVIAELALLSSGAAWQLPRILIGRSWLHLPRKQHQQIMVFIVSDFGGQQQ